MSFLKSHSIRKKFTFWMAITITVVMLSFSVVLIFYNSRSIESQLNGQLTKLITFSKESLASALWQYNYDYVNDYIESLFLYEDLVFASVVSNEMKMTKKTRPKFKELSFEDFRSSPNFIMAETDVVYKHVNVGRVQLVLSRERVGNLVMVSSALAILMLLIVNLAVFGTNLLLSRWYLFKPLSKLEASVRMIAGGNLDASVDITGKDEIGQLARSFKQMMENLKMITASRDDLNREIQERKKIEFELKNSLKEKEVLLKEVHHRVKNNMQIVQSLLNLQGGKIDSPDLKRAIQDSNNRIRSMALIHETLYLSDDFSQLNLDTYFASIVKGLYRIYHNPEKNIDWDVEIDPVQLDMDKSIACGLIVNELVTNSLKYAFVNNRHGHINIRLSQPSVHEAVLNVSDNGAGIPKDVHCNSFDSLGLQIVRMLSEDQLDGRIDFKNDNGLSVNIQFPI